MNRIVTFGLAGFFSLVGICLIGGPKQAKAFHGWPLCSCQSWHPWHGSQRCYTTSGCWGCCHGASQYCAASVSSGCWGPSRCYGCSGCSGCSGCQGAIYHSCHGYWGGDCGGYYPAAVPVIVVPAEPAAPPSAPTTSPAGKSTLVWPSIDSDLSESAIDRTVWIGGASGESFVAEAP
jgi:hypothetical protein